MAENSKISWCDATFNPWRGCTKVSAGCDLCYAERDSKRFPDVRGVWGKYGTRVVASESMWNEPVKWNRKAAEGWCRDCKGSGFFEKTTAACPICEGSGKVDPYRLRVFCASLADVFEGEATMPVDAVEKINTARHCLGNLVRTTPYLDWLFLTKRIENAMPLLTGVFGFSDGILPDNLWIGTSVEDQKTADERIPILLTIPARVRWLSMEPLLGPVDIALWLGDLGGRRSGAVMGLSWVVAGGESGLKARPTHPDWLRTLRDQCDTADVPFHFKQWGEWAPYREYWPLNKEQGGAFVGNTWYGERNVYPSNGELVDMTRYGKVKSGRELDGRTWDEFPEVTI